MASFSMTCSCGDTMNVDAKDRDEAVTKLRAYMTQEGLDTHFATKHDVKEPKPTLEQAHAMIGQLTKAA